MYKHNYEQSHSAKSGYNFTTVASYFLINMCNDIATVHINYKHNI